MPPGNLRTNQPVKVLERVTAEACLELALSVQRTKQQEGDAAGSEAANQVARLIKDEILVMVSNKPRHHPVPGGEVRFRTTGSGHH